MSFLYIYPDLFSTEDTGLVSGSSPENEDLGIVTLTADSRENLGSITIFTDIPDPYQLPEAYGSVADSVDLTDDYGLITESVLGNYISYGELLENILRIDNLTSSRKSRTYRYTLSSIGLFTVEDLGLLGDSVFYEEYGSIVNPNAEYDDGGYLINDTSNLNPFGEFSAFGGAAEVFGPNPPENTANISISGDGIDKHTEFWNASGTISAINGAAESRAYSYNDSSAGSESYGLINQTIDSVDDYGLIISSVDQISDYGGLLDGVVPYGTLSLSGQKVEKITHSYNESSIYVFGGYEDLGQLSDSVVYEDNGDLTYDYYRSFYDNYGYIVDGEFSVSPYGTISISGDADTNRQGENIGVGDGIIDTSGAATYKEINSEVGSGTLSAFGGAAESRAYSYNDSSTGPESYEFIIDAIDSFDDYGSIISSVNQISDYAGFEDGFTPYGTIVLSGDSTHKEIYSEVGSGSIGALSGSAEVYGPNPPENTVLFTVSGAATYSEINSEVASGTLSAIGGAAESRAYSYNDSSTGSESYEFIIDAIDSFDDYGSIISSVNQISDYGDLLDGSYPYGTISLSGQKVERVTYSYNESSIYTFGGYEDLGQLSDSVVYEDNGDLTYDYYRSFYDNYGYIVDGEFSVSPYGTISISGDAITIREGENVDTGSGNIDLSGNATYKDVNSEVGSGTLSAFGGAAESRAYSYNDSSISQPVDYGSVLELLDSIDDYGFIVNSADQIFDYAGFEDGFTPYGTLLLSGSSTHKEIYSEVASGSIGALSGAAEVYGPNPPENTVLFTISGDATYKEINSEVASGTLSAIGGAAESRAYSYNDSSAGSESYQFIIDAINSVDDYGSIISSVDQISDYGDLLDGIVPYGTLNISGQKIERVTYSYNESSIYTFGGYEDLGQLSDTVTYEDYGNLEFTLFYDQYGYVADAETNVSPFGTLRFTGDAITIREGENVDTGSGTIEIFGAATYSDINSEVGSGSLSAFGGVAESRVYSYNDTSISQSVDYGSVLESLDSIDDYGFIINSADQIFDYAGFDDGFTPYGTLLLSGSSIHKEIYNEVASGSIGSLSGAAEVYGPNPPENTVLFTISGDATYKEINSEVASGTIEISGSAVTRYIPLVATSGTIVLSGDSTHKEIYSEVASGSIGALSGAAEVYGPNPPENTVLFTISGDGIEKHIEFWDASGTLSAIGGAAESRVYSYNYSSSGSESYGLITQTIDSLDDYGLITSSVDQISDYGDLLDGIVPYGTLNFSGNKVERVTYSYNESSIYVFGGYEDLGQLSDSVVYEDNGDLTYDYYSSFYDNYGYILDGESSVSPYGTITVSGDAITIREGENVDTGSGTIEISGDATYSEINSEVASGTLSAFGGAAESRAYSYNDSSISQSIDYGLINDGIDSIDDYGFIVNSADQIFDYAGFEDGFTPYGTIVFSGESTYKEINSEVGSGSIGALSGAAEVYGPNPPENTVLFTISGDATYKEINSEVASGTISAINGAAESRVYSYNDSSIGTESYEFIIDAIDSFDDYGSIISSVDQISDYGVILDGISPYGTLNFSGNKVERVTYSYNESSIYTFGGYEDLGQLSDSVVYEDNGDLTYDYYRSSYDNYGYIIDGEFSVSPYGTIRFTGDAITSREGANIYVGSVDIEISGDATYREINSEVASGTLSAIGGAAESRVYSYNDSSTGSESYGSVVEINDSFDDYGLITSSVDQISDYGDLLDGIVPYGTIQVSGQKVERVTYSYNESSIYTFGGYEDLGQLSDSVVYEDYGNLGFTLFYDQYGYIVDAETNVSPFGTITSFGNAEVIPLLLSPSSGNIDLSGNATYSEINREVASGTLSAFGGAAESRVYSYNESSIGSESYEFITDSIDSIDDYGLIISPVDQVADYGGVLDSSTPYGTLVLRGDSIFKQTQFWTASGTIDISGSAVTKYVPLVSASGTIEISGSLTESYTPATEIGSGTIGILSGAAEVYGPNPPENTVLFTISGNAVDRQIEFWTASGTVEISGSANAVYQSIIVTSGTIVLSGDSTHKEIYSEVGSGSIGALSGAAEVYGPNPPENTVLFTISGDATYKEINSEVASGTIEISGSANAVYQPIIVTSGIIDVSGDATYSDINSEVGSGTLNTFGGSAEVYGPNPPENTVLFTISGDATYSDINSEVGFGTVEISGEGSVPRRRHYIGSGTIEISGAFAESYTPATEIGSGTLSAFGGSAEVYGPNPPENTVLFTISGDAVDRQTDSWTASGTIEISGEGSIPRRRDYIGSGSIGALSGAAEVYGPNPPENTVLFTISGDAVDRQTDSWTASGTIEISGTNKQNVQVYVPVITGNCEIEIGSSAIYQFQSKPIIFGGGLIEISGALAESYTPATEIGSGSIGALSGAAEVYGPNPPENTVLFTISGDANTRYFNVYTGPASGTIEISGGISTDKGIYIPNYTASGTVEVSGNVEINRAVTHVGSGIISISGISEESFSRGLYTGSGSFSIFGGHAEEFGANPPEDTVIGIISGSSVPKKVFSYVATGSASISVDSVWKFAHGNYEGSGTLRTFSGAAEVYGPNPPENTVLFEINGEAIQKVRFVESGIGTATFSGGSIEKYETSNVGIGTLNISGAATPIAKINNFVGSGLIEISGQRNEQRTFGYNGSGTLSAIRGSAEAFGANPPENIVILTIGGGANTRYFNVYTGPASGTIEISGGISTDRQIFPPRITGSGIIQVFGNCIETRNVSYNSSGTITILGSAKESYNRSNYNGDAQINVSGTGSYEYREYQPPFTYVTII